MTPTNPPNEVSNYMNGWRNDAVPCPADNSLRKDGQIYSAFDPEYFSNLGFDLSVSMVASADVTHPVAAPQPLSGPVTVPVQSLPCGPVPTSPDEAVKHHRRNVSEASMVSAASISDLDVEATRTETGITSDQINGFINSPATSNDKWTCLFPGCNKMFGRKENIKSHVQTHLGDRQYKCPTCNKCFVRQHDLKRHAKIHTGVRAYACECSNLFARHDALTRHRQRGMCVGALDIRRLSGKKRGRPPKNPDATAKKQGQASRLSSSVSSSAVQSPATDSSEHFPNAPSPEFHIPQAFVFNPGTSTILHAQADTQELQSTAPMPTIGLQPNAPIPEFGQQFNTPLQTVEVEGDDPMTLQDAFGTIADEKSPMLTPHFDARRSPSLTDSAVGLGSPVSSVSPKVLMIKDRSQSTSPGGTTSGEQSPLAPPIDYNFTENIGTTQSPFFHDIPMPSMPQIHGPDFMDKTYIRNSEPEFKGDNDTTLLIESDQFISQDLFHQEPFA
ncbi:hypothetical protein CDD82_161 [Ophiocordyceps australis]|uniref:C2H2-type domain-containing protein n=1 Tax=Ophiocordyceps australis TaxID=1399860 RepID=A0A2C5YNT7_9HYPO|nr:hypothetical protein CDD82_161 [Ophiocordyceps australis]